MSTLLFYFWKKQNYKQRNHNWNYTAASKLTNTLLAQSILLLEKKNTEKTESVLTKKAIKKRTEEGDITARFQKSSK